MVRPLRTRTHGAHAWIQYVRPLQVSRQMKGATVSLMPSGSHSKKCIGFFNTWNIGLGAASKWNSDMS